MKVFFAGIILSAALAVKAQTSEALLDYSANAGGFANGTAGWDFTPLTNVSVTALGAFQYVVTNTGPVAVGLWDANGTLLASNTITANSQLVNRSLYELVTPVSLTAGQTYFLGAYGGTMIINIYSPNLPNGGPVTMSSDIQLGSFVAADSPGFVFPNAIQGLGGSALFAPNFEFEITPVPEPSSLWLFSGGILIWSLIRRR